MSEKYNTTLIALWETKNGNAMSMEIDERSFKQLAKAFDKVNSDGTGGKFILKRLSDETREKFPNPETAPHYFFEYISADNVAEYAAKNPKKSAQSSASRGI